MQERQLPSSKDVFVGVPKKSSRLRDRQGKTAPHLLANLLMARSLKGMPLTVLFSGVRRRKREISLSSAINLLI